jgi:hypothetical protein
LSHVSVILTPPMQAGSLAWRLLIYRRAGGEAFSSCRKMSLTL